jgi:hypothetical protein
MSSEFLNYQLRHGYVDHWLAAGPYLIPAADPASPDDGQAAQPVATAHAAQTMEPALAPCEGAKYQVGQTALVWKTISCDEDHVLDFATSSDRLSHLTAWAYSEVESPVAQEVELTLLANSPADLWLNGMHLLRQEKFGGHRVAESVLFAALQPGWNRIWVRLAATAAGPIPAGFGLHIGGIAQDSAVRLPTELPEPELRRQLKQMFARAYLDRDVFAAEDEVEVRWPADLTQSAPIHFRLQDQAGPIFLEFSGRPEAGATTSFGRAAQVEDGRYQATLMTLPEDYYTRRLRVQHALPFHVAREAYSQDYYGTGQERREEALRAATRYRGSLFGEIAKMALDQWGQVRPQAIRQAIARVETAGPSTPLDLLGLLHIVYRYGRNPSFEPDLLEAIEAAILNFDGWSADSESAAPVSPAGDRAILSYAAEILAGQIYYDRRFTATGQSGQRHRQQAQRAALAWLHRRGAYGFDGWGGPIQSAESVVALSHLVEFARSTQLREMAAVVLDKILFRLALHSYRGAFCAPYSDGETDQIVNGRLQATAGICRLLWGMGNFNEHCAGPVSLALSERYEMPGIIQNIALDLAPAVWTQERHAASVEANCAAYRTADYLLASAQDHRAGELGERQHIWQAALGPDAIVFVNHPGCVSQSDAYRPNFWRGNGVLPRAAQWKEALIALYRLPQDDRMGYTHAYFPLYAFDEFRLQDGWAFARKGDGYVALAAANGLGLVTYGSGAYRELRSYGHENAWLCHMGQASIDGSFSAFAEKMLALPIEWDADGVRCSTLRGDALSFGWQGGLQVNGEERPTAGFRHHESIYGEAELPAHEMFIRHGEQAMRLKFDLEDDSA